MAKTKDLFLNIIANPTMTLEDFASVGLTSENTMLLDRAQYASNEKVQNMFKDADGNFDEAQFNLAYDLAVQNYNILATDEANLNLLNVTAYDQDNIFVDPSRRRQKNEPFITKLPNLDRLNVGVTRIGKIGPHTLSQDEIAQTQQVLLNPTEVAKGAKPIYGKTPNESWFEDFWDTRVMAAWDEDGTHIDPVTGLEVQHQKGDLKLNENGTYYYENLDGRSVYGKRILNKFNTLTTDGSSWNKYDFFDSDDIEQKSIGGSVVKNLALVGSMFIPYVGWGIAAASVAHQMVGLTATFGKMLVGADNEALNNLEGWVKSTDRRNLKTEYAQQNMWCWENFIDLVGDTAAQLREQRAIFKFVPGIIKGDFKAINEKAMQKYTQDLAQEYMDNATKLSLKDIIKLAKEKNPANWKEQVNLMLKGASDVFTEKAKKAAQDYVTNYYKLGEPIAKAYMTAITVQDMFGEAIEAGASNNEATLLTLGYAAAEAALLSTDLGKWIMPELRTEKLRMKIIAKKLFELSPETRNMSEKLSQLSGETKKQWVKRLFNIGKDICTAEYSTMAKTAGTVLAQGLGEGIEEVSEELLADFSKSCFNLVKHLQGDDVRMSAWEDMGNRYAMSFAGGILGGGINAAASDYKANRELTNMNSQQAMQQIVYMTRNGKMDDFWKVVDKTTLASKELSTKMNEDGTYKPGTKDDNQDLEAKRFLRQQIGHIESIINAENAKLDDNGLLATLINADPSLKDMDPVKEYRMRALANSATAGRLLNEWNTIVSDITKNRLDQATIMSKYGDENSEKYSEEDKQTLKEKQRQVKELQKRKEAILNGERTREYIRDALFEMTHPVKDVFDDWATEIRYIEAKTGKKYIDVSEEEKNKLKEKYEQLKSSNEYAEQIHELANIYEYLAQTSSNAIQTSADFYEQLRQDNYKNISKLNKLVLRRFNKLAKGSQEDDAIVNIQKILDLEVKDELLAIDDTAKLLNDLNILQTNSNIEIANLIAGRDESELSESDKKNIENIQAKANNDAKLIILKSSADKVKSVCEEFMNVGFIHPETKAMLQNLLNESIIQLNPYTTTDSSGLSAVDGVNPDTLNIIYPNVNSYQAVDNLSDELYEIQSTFQQLKEQLDNLTHTPIVENLRKFQLSTNVDSSVIDFIDLLIKKENDERIDISTFQLENPNLIKDAKKLLELYRSTIVGARYDNVDIDTIVGFNTTLNELSGDSEKLAEIDAQTADLILQDIDNLLNRLDYSDALHTLNSGNKYNVQNKTALNKQFIIHNKIKHFVSILGDDENDEELKALKTTLSNARTLNNYAGTGNYETRNFGVTPEDKVKIEKESIEIQTALHNYLNKHINNSEESINKLAKLLTYDNFKGLIRKNDNYLDQNSQDIDDSAFIWWLCATAALNPNQFYNHYRQIIGTEEEGESPIAPIPTQELGVFTLTAAVANGDMFSIFGKALRKSLLETWEKGPDTRQKIREEYGDNLLDEDFKEFFKNNDFLPNFDNIIFIEGIAGSGKSTGVLKTWSKLLSKINPEFVKQKIFIAHTDKTKADNLGESTSFENYEAYDHDSLLSYMSADYTPNPTGEYIMGKDAILVDGILKSNWKTTKYDINNVPKLIVIDEWSHYNQLEQELIQRFAQEYGITVITMGDYDQLTPSASIKKSESSEKPEIILTPNRNMTPRIAKLGVSMRTDNEIKNGNMYRMLAWKQNPTDHIDLHYYEDETGIYGDKRYAIYDKYGDKLDKIKLDVQKMISTLKDGEKIGYIYSDTESELYKYLTTTEGVKEHIQSYTEKDAHGREAQYYIIENNRSSDQDALSYFESVYTGITRSEQGSIIITGTSTVKRGSLDEYNKFGLSFQSKQDSEMLPNTFTDAGTREFSRKRKAIFDQIYQDSEVTPIEFKPRKQTIISLTPDIPEVKATSLGISAVISESTPVVTIPESPVVTSSETSTTETNTTPSVVSQPVEETNTTTTSSELTSEETSSTEDLSTSPNVSEEAFNQIDLNDIPPERTEEEVKTTESVWQGPLKKGQILYSKSGIAKYTIIGENNDDYILKKLQNDEEKLVSKNTVHNASYLTLPEYNKQFNIGDKINLFNKPAEIQDIYLNDNKSNPEWVYKINGKEYTHESILKFINDGNITTYIENVETPPVTAFELGNRTEYEEMLDDEMAEIEKVIEQKRGKSAENLENKPGFVFKFLGFTFNNQYLANKFDEDGNIILNDQNDARIDNGYGLYKINSRAFKHKEDIRECLGKIRKCLEFSSNAKILDTIQELTGLTGLKMKWAFISKMTEGKHKPPYNRFNHDKGGLEYMLKEDNDVPTKTISAIIYDRAGNPILELPIISFQSPHSIFRELLKNGVAKDITNMWTFGKKEERKTFNELTSIHNYIEANHANHQGYKELAAIIKMWLFTNNGVKTLPENWNLHENLRNLGNIYVTERTSDNHEEHNFRGTWMNLTDHVRKDRFISSIMMNKQNEFVIPGSNEKVTIFRPYVPYVFISDDPSITSDKLAAEQYLKQLAHPEMEPIVKVIPVVPPEVDAKTYIEAMHRVLTHDKTRTIQEPYGNKYTPFRIWESIFQSFEKDNIMVNLSPEDKQFVINTINQLHQEINKLPTISNESKLEYKRRLAEAQNKILNQSIQHKNSEIKVFEKLRRLLVETCFYNDLSGPYVNENVLNTIQKVFTDAGNTGILCHSHFAPNQQGNEICGFASLVDTENKFNFPGQGSFRIFGKIDPPTYDITSLLTEEVFLSWANDAFKGKKFKDKKTGEVISYENLWSFANDHSFAYLSGESQQFIDIDYAVNKGKEILAKLGISDYNIDISKYDYCETTAELTTAIIDDIHRKYLDNNFGAFIVMYNNNVYKYGNIITDRTPEFENYKFVYGPLIQKSVGEFYLKFIDTVSGNEVLIQIQFNNEDNSFSIIPPSPENDNETNTLNVSKLKQEIISKFEKSIWGQKNPNVVSKLLSYFDEDTNTINIDGLNQEIESLSRLVQTSVKNTLQLDQLNNEKTKDYCINPIKIMFK